MRVTNIRMKEINKMRINKVVFGILSSVVALSGVAMSAQNNCAGKPAYGTCAAPAAPVQVWCAGNNSASTCPGGKSFVGFDTTAPAAGNWTNQFEALDASSILNAEHIPGAEPDPNGGVGPTNSKGVGQYLEFADNYIQAFDKQTASGILSNQANGTAAPQTIGTLFAPGGSSYCANPSLDGIASYDRIDSAFVVANIFNSKGNYYFCIGVSAPNGSVPASNLEGVNGESLWNVYAYNLSPAIPKNAEGVTYFPDYVRFGTWSDGFYISWDLMDVSNGYDIVGVEVCQLDKADIIAGLSSNSPKCYTYIPSYVVGTSGTDRSLIHTLLPADFEGDNPIPSNTAGEYFLALLNPRNPGTKEQCSVSPCTSNQLAFWTWSGLTSGAAPTYIALVDHAFTPGCYAPAAPYNTYCVPEPYGRDIDGLGDRLSYRLAYRNIPGASGGEYLAVAHAVQENSNTRRTGIRYYKILAGSSPTVDLIGDIQDKTDFYFLSMPSVAMDSSGNLGITYTVTGSTAHGSAHNYDPSPFFVTVGSTGTQGTPVAILSNSGASGQDETDQDWGEFVSVSSDPDNDSTFWAVDEYMNGTQTGNCSYKLGVGSGCTWASRVFTCQKGSGC
jgi:hypothetical protein